MDKWNEMRTAYQVAALGTVTAAAEALGIHRATVIRHIDALEEELGAKVFQRHARGYTPTDAGLDLLRVAQATEDQFAQLAGRTRGRGAAVSGELIVTSVELLAPMLMPAIRAFRVANPATSIRFVASGRIFKLEYGEAHVAVRSGPEPDHPDNVVRPFFTLRNGVYAHRDYVAARGLPTEDDIDQHDFIGAETPMGERLPFTPWMKQHVPEDRITFRSSNQRILFRALLCGLGVGFYPAHEAQKEPDLIEIIPPRPAWDVPFWLVTHVDLHRSAKVQAFLSVLRHDRR